MIFLTAIGGFVGLMALIALSSVWRGYVLTVLWAWFVVPTFGLPALALAPAIGLSLVVSFLTHQLTSKEDDKRDFSDRMARAIGVVLLMPLFVLGIGWVVRQFM
jgi:hypothetical protein